MGLHVIVFGLSLPKRAKLSDCPHRICCCDPSKHLHTFPASGATAKEENIVLFTFMAVILDPLFSSLSDLSEAWELQLNVIVSVIVDIGNQEPQQTASALVG